MTELWSVRGLKKTYRSRAGAVRAVQSIDVHLNRSEILAIVGESGSGKSTLGRMLVGLEPSDGPLEVNGVYSQDRLLPKAPMVFQDSMGSLNPRRTVIELVAEPLLIRAGRYRMTQEMRSRASRVAEQVGLQAELFARRPHELSGGQRQRVNIGRALVGGDPWCLLDEPVSALDVSIQAQIVNLLLELRETSGLAMIFITHDLALTRFLADRVMVIHKGVVVEQGPTETLFQNPQSPYTQLLLASEPRL